MIANAVNTSNKESPISLLITPLCESDIIHSADVFVSAFQAEPWNEEWRHEDALERLSELYANPSSLGIKAEYNNEQVGFALGYIEKWQENKKFFIIEFSSINFQNFFFILFYFIHIILNV